jgi:hypothetical protein
MRYGPRRAAALVTVCAVAAAAALATPRGSVAAYAPNFSVELGSPAPGIAPSVTTTVTQSEGETATRTVRVHYPPQFGFNPSFSAPGCTPAQEQAAQCPPASRIGSAEAATGLGRFAGEVYFTSDYRLAIFLRDFTGLLVTEVVGTFRVLEDGTREVALENLPDVPATSSVVALEGGSRGLLLTPENCAVYKVRALFESHEGEAVTTESPIEIAGCEGRLLIEALRVRPRHFSAPDGRSGNRGATLSWRLTRSAAWTDIAVERRAEGSWRRITTLRGSAGAGQNELHLPGRLPARAQRPGRYRVVLRAVAADGARSPSRATQFRILPSR